MSEMKDLMDEVVSAIPKLSRGGVVKATVLDVSAPNGIIVDIGAKTEGIIPLSEMSEIGGVSVGQEIDVYIIDLAGTDGHPTLSYTKAQKYRHYRDIEKAYEDGSVLQAEIKEKIKGGVLAEIDGIEAFMPNSQIGYPPVKNIAGTIGQTVPVKIKKFNQRKNDVVISWRDVVEEEYKEKQVQFWEEAREGEIREGTVKGITKFGAFVDIGGFEGLLHIKDISWGRTENVADELEIGQKIKVKITKLNRTANRVSLSMKEIMPHPWDGAAEKYPVGSIHKGVVRGIVDYGAFIELEPGLEGLLHVSELSWDKNAKPSEILTVGSEIEVMVLNVDNSARRISLSAKNTQENPWSKYASEHSSGDVVSGSVTHLVKNGAVVDLSGGVEGFVLLKEFSWKERVEHPSDVLREGETIQVKILDIRPDEQKIYLGIKQMQENPYKDYESGRTVKCTVTETSADRIFVDLKDGIKGFIHISQVADEKTEDLSEFTPGMELEAVVVKVNENSRMVELSIRELRRKKDNETMQQYYSSESTGFSIGDILKKE